MTDRTFTVGSAVNPTTVTVHADRVLIETKKESRQVQLESVRAVHLSAAGGSGKYGSQTLTFVDIGGREHGFFETALGGDDGTSHQPAFMLAAEACVSSLVAIKPDVPVILGPSRGIRNLLSIILGGIALVGVIAIFIADYDNSKRMLALAALATPIMIFGYYYWVKRYPTITLTRAAAELREKRLPTS